MRELKLCELKNVSGGQEEGLNPPTDSHELTTGWTFLRDVYGLSDIQITSLMLSEGGIAPPGAAVLLCSTGLVSEFQQNDSSSNSAEASGEAETSAQTILGGASGSVGVSGAGSTSSDAGWSVKCN